MNDQRPINTSWKHLAAGVMADVRLYTLPMTKHIFVTPEERQQEPN
ncbi:MAG: hypothetical protein HOH33_13975 [Verrucomicrobia bacterium]|nr:hypothetical protein [Verrucomicrobiota bacterium]